MTIALVMLLVIFFHCNSCRSKVWKAQPRSQGSLLPVPTERERDRQVGERTWKWGCEKPSTFLINKEEGEVKKFFFSLTLKYFIISDWTDSRNKKRTYVKTSNKKKGEKAGELGFYKMLVLNLIHNIINSLLLDDLELLVDIKDNLWKTTSLILYVLKHQ